jgi:acetate kinase
MNGLDAIILRRELGRILLIRKLVCTDMEYFGMELDEAKNEIRSKEMQYAHSKTKNYGDSN